MRDNGTLRYEDADALKYATIEESLGRERSVRGGKIKLRRLERVFLLM